MTEEQANIFCYVFAGMSLNEFALKMMKDINEENQNFDTKEINQNSMKKGVLNELHKKGR